MQLPLIIHATYTLYFHDKLSPVKDSNGAQIPNTKMLSTMLLTTRRGSEVSGSTVVKR